MRAAARRAAASLKRPALARAGPFVFSGLGGRPRRVPAPCVVRATNARRVRGPAGRPPSARRPTGPASVDRDGRRGVSISIALPPVPAVSSPRTATHAIAPHPHAASALRRSLNSLASKTNPRPARMSG
ncbi:hypothetical protein C7S16_5300 [Burkholderia thailandensis]|uniref:Uncharacterized protein n=1 Tax=Burkholderia thailandensis TaxID=57975 RepID=A0AAW9CTJ6_BURTH|nr:hypothetical protein [Burkholderia thailandensis]MDW9251066.1 hypothetical protein [Burkholderia thailandensis]